MRKSEVLKLRWSQVEFRDDGRAVIRLSAADTKTKKAREIPLTKRVSASLAELRERPRPMRGFVFVNPETGKAWVEIRKMFDRAREAAELPHVHLHDMRRSFCTNARKQHLAESVIMRISGHKTRTVFERYNIVDDDDVLEAVKVIEAAQESALLSPDGKVLERLGSSGKQKASGDA
jgi:integrase